VTGIWPAKSVGDDIEVYNHENGHKILGTFRFLRQQQADVDKNVYHCLADFIAPKGSGRKDYLGCFVVTAGWEVETFAATFSSKLDDYHAIMVKALGDRFAEALAELMHKEARIGDMEWRNLTHDDLIRERYREYVPRRVTLHALITRRKPCSGNYSNPMKILAYFTENFAMNPPSSVSGWYIAHPEAKYFHLGK
jgi:5-methyltetrahydrofolate--homocysteine methyltransferase